MVPGNAGTSPKGEDWFEIPALLLESRLYSVHEHTLLGLFPVYTIDIDFSALTDNTTRAAIQRYLDRKKDIPGER